MDAAFAAITFHGKPHEYLTTPCHDPLETSLLESVDGANLAPPTYTVSGTHPIQATTPHPLTLTTDLLGRCKIYVIGTILSNPMFIAMLRRGCGVKRHDISQKRVQYFLHPP